MTRSPIEGGRHDRSAYTWYGLKVLSQKERLIERFLNDEGFATFVVVRRSWEFANGSAKAVGRKRERVRAIIPGLIFIGMNANTPSWARVFCYRDVLGVIGTNGVPSPIPFDGINGRVGLRDIMDRQGAGEFNAPGYEKYMVGGKFKVGDEVTDATGSISGRVIEIEGDAAMLLVNLMGSERTARASLASLRPAVYMHGSGDL